MLEEYNHTMELRMLGTRLVMTDDPENIKAIQDTQVLSLHAAAIYTLSEPSSSGRSPNQKNNMRSSSTFSVMLSLPVCGPADAPYLS